MRDIALTEQSRLTLTRVRACALEIEPPGRDLEVALEEARSLSIEMVRLTQAYLGRLEKGSVQTRADFPQLNANADAEGRLLGSIETQ